jgi:hypothetical protein
MRMRMRIAAAIPTVVASVLAAAACGDDLVCRQEPFAFSSVATTRDVLCTLEAEQMLGDPPISSGYANPGASGQYSTIPLETCARFCPRASDVCGLMNLAFVDLDPPRTGTCPVTDDAARRVGLAGLEIYCQATETHEVCYTKEQLNHGRRPDGYLAPVIVANVSSVARYFSLCAHLEAASVVAFEALRAELALHGFPDDVLAACRRAGKEETRHASVVGALAMRFGAQPPPLEMDRIGTADGRAPPRALVDIAIENAVEGCVREVFGAAEALFRARRTADRELGATLEQIAADEIGHAELSMEIAQLLHLRLDNEERARVRAAHDDACVALRSTLARRAPDAALVDVAGFPRAAEAVALFDALHDAIWSRDPLEGEKELVAGSAGQDARS